MVSQIQELNPKDKQLKSNPVTHNTWEILDLNDNRLGHVRNHGEGWYQAYVEGQPINLPANSFQEAAANLIIKKPEPIHIGTNIALVEVD